MRDSQASGKQDDVRATWPRRGPRLRVNIERFSIFFLDGNAGEIMNGNGRASARLLSSVVQRHFTLLMFHDKMSSRVRQTAASWYEVRTPLPFTATSDTAQDLSLLPWQKTYQARAVPPPTLYCDKGKWSSGVGMRLVEMCCVLRRRNACRCS